MERQVVRQNVYCIACGRPLDAARFAAGDLCLCGGVSFQTEPVTAPASMLGVVHAPSWTQLGLDDGQSEIKAAAEG